MNKGEVSSPLFIERIKMVHGKKPLDARLRAAVELMLEAIRDIRDPVVADVGCDHGLATAYLLRQRPDLNMIASDISEPSLHKTQVLLQQSALENRAVLICGDGLDATGEYRVDGFLIAGMGGLAIVEILKKGAEKIGDRPLILQANTDIPMLRKGLAELGIGIEKEVYPEVNGRIYTVIKATRGVAPHTLEKDFFLGNVQSSGRSAGRKRYLGKIRDLNCNQMLRIINQARNKNKLEELRQQLGWIEEELGMKEMKCRDLLSLVNEVAPFEMAEEWDNVGLLLGSKDQLISRVLIALDLTQSVFDEAIQIGAQAILTHHPFMFHPIQRITDESREGRLMLQMAKAGVCHIAAHTNLDAAPGGVNDTLMQLMGATNIRGEGCLRVGDIDTRAFKEMCDLARNKLNAQIRTYGNPEKQVHTLGCCSGAGSDYYRDAMALGADCFITGEVRHNVGLDAIDDGCPIIEAGHYETEAPVCRVLCDALQKKADAVEYKVTFFCSSVDLLERRA